MCTHILTKLEGEGMLEAAENIPRVFFLLFTASIWSRCMASAWTNPIPGVYFNLSHKTKSLFILTKFDSRPLPAFLVCVNCI